MFSVEKLPDFVHMSALSDTALVLGAIRTSANSVLQNATTMPQFLRDLNTISNTAGSLIRFPSSLARSLLSQVAGIRTIARSPLDAFRSLSGLFNFGTGFVSIAGTTPARKQQAENQQAMIDLTRTSALIEASRASSEIEFTSHDEALAIRTDLADRLEAASETAPDTIYVALMDMRSAVVRDITARGTDLSRIVRYTPGSTLPALVVAHQLYSDAGRESEIVSRNRIRHPGFIAGGRPLEVLA